MAPRSDVRETEQPQRVILQNRTYLFLTFGLIFLWQFGYLTVAIRRFYLANDRWGGWLLSVAAALLLYALNTAFMTAVQVAGAAIALALI